MHNNIPYYNAISREAIVKRVMDYAGETYSFDKFKENDRESIPSSSTKAAEQSRMFEIGLGGTASSGYTQMPPKFMGEKPSFRIN